MEKSRFSYQKTNGGGNGYTALEASGNYVVIAIENRAYGKPKNCVENKEMNSFLQDMQPGVTATFDAIHNDLDRKNKGNTPGGIYGHIAVKRHDNHWGCDFEQKSFDFSRYGKYVRICVPKDAEIPAEYAQQLIERAKERQQEKSKVLQQVIVSKEGSRE